MQPDPVGSTSEKLLRRRPMSPRTGCLGGTHQRACITLSAVLFEMSFFDSPFWREA